MTVRENLVALRNTLAPAVGADEADAMARLILEKVKGYTAVEIAMHGHRELLPETENRIAGIAARVIAGEPLQYVLGSAWFHGREFYVAPGVLIPRPETSQLCDIIADNYKGRKDLRVLDVGTGSGCIAVTLALDLYDSRVDAVDISAGAITIARKNADALKARVNFVVADAFRLDSAQLNQPYDIIVSNPPYILLSEAADMDTRVSMHEPAEALFMHDDHPIEIYQAIARYAINALAPDGTLYFEINPLCANILKKMLRDTGFADTSIECDYKGTKRFAICRRY